MLGITYLKYFIVSKWSVGHHDAVIKLVHRASALRCETIVAQFDKRSASFVKCQAVVGVSLLLLQPGAELSTRGQIVSNLIGQLGQELVSKFVSNIIRDPGCIHSTC